jgi:ribonuclease R
LSQTPPPKSPKAHRKGKLALSSAQVGTKPARKQAPFPSREQLADYLKNNPGAAKREIIRAFGITGDQRIELKILLKQLERDGVYSGKITRRVALPSVAVIDVLDVDEDGDALAAPFGWAHDEPPPRIYLSRDANDRVGAPATGDRLLARLERRGHVFEAFPIRKLETRIASVVGVFEKTPNGGFIRSTLKRDREEYRVARADMGDAQTGELVRAEVIPSRGGSGQRVKIIERLGVFGSPRSFSMAAIATAEIPLEFPPAAVAEAEAAQPVPLGSRTDLRDIPLVTIDGADARDFDDAVFAEPDTDPENPGGWHLLVAIADVAHYVRPLSALDKSAYERGNSVYFPDRVVPMLPEALSNDLCSLRPDGDRACMAVHIWIDRKGRKLSHRFVRGLMRSRARLIYEQVQQAQDGTPDEMTAPLLEPVIRPLYGAFQSLLKAREARGTLELDIPERQVTVDRETGAVLSIRQRLRLDAHKLIEEFMIAANVCAAESLEAAKQPCMYRIHDEPSTEKLLGLRESLKTMDLSLPKGQVLEPSHFTRLLEKAAETPFSQMISEMVLRSQAQAVYSPENIGQFGLALRRYAHFTSPIRRYADLLVHRALISGLALPEGGGLEGGTTASFEQMAEHITVTERRAAAAEREVVDRYTASFLAAQTGAEFRGRISGVTRFGLFVQMVETGADGLVPIRTLPQDYYHHDEVTHSLVGDRNGRTYRLGDPVIVRLEDVDIVTGGIVLSVVEEEGSAPPAGPRPTPKARARTRSLPPSRRKGRR